MTTMLNLIKENINPDDCSFNISTDDDELELRIDVDSHRQYHQSFLLYPEIFIPMNTINRFFQPQRFSRAQ